MRRLSLQLLTIVSMLTAVLGLGTLGFRLVEGWSWFDSFYMALISLTTVGYEELFPLSHAGRVFTSVLLIVGVTVVFASIGLLGDLILKLELANFFGKRRAARMVSKLSNHYIVCGAGRVGRGVINELRRSGVQLVLVDNSLERTKWAEALGVPVVAADATQDETLLEAGIERAMGLVAAIGSDAENVYVTLSARVLNPTLRIAARATTEEAEEKLRRAGAATVFTPYTFIGHRLAQSLLRPHVLSFLDVASALGGDLDVETEQVKVSDDSAVAGKTLEESRLRQALGVIVLAVIRPDGSMQFNPGGDTKIEGGDVLIAMGERERLLRMERTVEGR